MKRVLLLTLLVLLTVSISAAAADYQAGHYVGFVPNDHGDVVVEVGISTAGKIIDVNIVSPVKLPSNYDYEEGINAYINYPAKVIESQNTDIDVVSGATGSYTDYNAAVQMALDIASGNYDGNKYYGLAKNYAHGHVLVELVKDGDSIKNVSLITDENNSENVTLMPPKGDDYGSEPALEFYKTFGEKAVNVMKEKPYEVDLITGATHSYHSYNAALRDALTQAGFDI